MFNKIRNAKYLNKSKNCVIANIYIDFWVDCIFNKNVNNDYDKSLWDNMLKLTNNGADIAPYTPPTQEELEQQAAQQEQDWVVSEITWVESEERFAGDDEREEYPCCELCDYKIKLRDHVTCDDEGILTVHGDRPVRPVKNALQMALDHKVAAIDKLSDQHIATEFQSDALGTVHSYDCRKIDQLNLQHAIYESQTTNSAVEYLAKPSGQSYQEKPHTESQLRQVHLAMTAHIRQHRDIARSKKASAYLGFENQDIDAINAVDENDWS